MYMTHTDKESRSAVYLDVSQRLFARPDDQEAPMAHRILGRKMGKTLRNEKKVRAHTLTHKHTHTYIRRDA